MKKLLMFVLLLSSSLLWASDASFTKEVTLDDGRIIMADAKTGLTLYTFDVDDAGVSNCFGRCLNAWPVFATEEDSLEEPFGIHTREDGTKQVMLNDEPLYFFVGDQAEGDINGDDLNGVWHIIEL